MGLKDIADKAKLKADEAKRAFEERGGIEGLKAEASRVKESTSGKGSLKEKVAAARDAITHKDGGDGTDTPAASTSAAPADQPPSPPQS